MVDNYDDLMLGKYMEIQAISKQEGLEEIDRQVQILAILSGKYEEEILHMPIGEYKRMVEKASFLSAPELNYHPISKKYYLGGMELHPVRDFRKLEAGQYVDFQTYAPTHFFSLRIAVLLLLLLNKTDVSSKSGDVYMTGHTEWPEGIRAVRMLYPGLKGRRPCYTEETGSKLL